MTDWLKWHESYEDHNSALSQRLEVVRRRIAESLDRLPAGPIRVASMCAGDGRDILGVLGRHPRAGDVSGRLVEWDQRLVERARASAPPAIEVVCGNAGISDAYEGGVFGNITEVDIRNTIDSWPMLCAPEATVIWTRGAFDYDLRPQIREWVKQVGFEELSFDGENEQYGVGVAKMIRASEPYRKGVHFFRFIPKKEPAC